MPRGGKQKNSGRKPRDVTDQVHMWIIERIRYYLNKNQNVRNERWKKKHLKSEFHNHYADANEHFTKIVSLKKVRKLSLAKLKTICEQKLVQQLTELDCPEVKRLKNIELEIYVEHQHLLDLFGNDAPSGGLLTPVPKPSHFDMSRAFKCVATESTNFLEKKATVRQVKDAWAAWQHFESQFKKGN